MRIKVLLLLALGISSICMAQPGTFLERTKLAFKSGNSQKLGELMAEKIQFGMDGEANTLKVSEAEKKLADFFKSHAPSDLSQLFEGKSKDGKKYFIGDLATKNGTFRISVYWNEAVQPKLISIDISPGS